MDCSVSDVVITIPIYKSELDRKELISIKQCFSLLSRYSIVFFAPEDLDVAWYDRIFSKPQIIRFSSHYFRNIDGYNALLLSTAFYIKFIQYKFMLIYQPDAFVFNDELLKFCNMDYDYIGAPWLDGMLIHPVHLRGAILLNKIIPVINKPVRCFVGNGGLSLKNIMASIRLIESASPWRRKLIGHEDAFWSLYGTRSDSEFNIAPIDIALQFAFETNPERCYVLNGEKLPFGCHAWGKYDIDFVRPVFSSYQCDI